MDKQRKTGRYKVMVEEGIPHGDLYELEQEIYYKIVDTHSKKVIMRFQGELEASLSRTTGMWENYHISSGVCHVSISPDEQSAIVQYSDGHEETMLLS